MPHNVLEQDVLAFTSKIQVCEFIHDGDAVRVLPSPSADGLRRKRNRRTSSVLILSCRFLLFLLRALPEGDLPSQLRR